MMDYIDRAAAITSPLWAEDLCPAAVLSRLPAADIAPVVHGKWEWFGPCYDGNGKFWGTCSVCQTRQRLGDYYTHCPVCGAKMDLEEE